MEIFMNPRVAKPMAGAVHNVGKLNHYEWVGRSQSRQVPKDNERHREVHNMCQDNEDKEVATKEFDVARSKVFVFIALDL